MSGFSAKVEDDALARAAGRCEGPCRGQLKPGRYQVHHKIPRWKGGDNSLSNALVLCSACHLAAEQDHDFDNMRTADRKAKVKKDLPVAAGKPEIGRRFKQ
jgi:5-methylcytosine-specific restriction endonuclease McrA